MKNKTVIRALKCAAFAAVVALPGCDFLDRSPTGQVSGDDFFRTKDQALSALTAAYDVLGWQAVTETHEWFLGDIVSDDALKGGESPVDQGDVQALRDFTNSTTNSVLSERWNALFQGVRRTNLVLENVDKVPELKDSAGLVLAARIKGEAQFLRGYLYFSLYNTFGPVPVYTATVTADKYCVARSTAADVWARIEADFKDAAAALPEKDALAGSDLGRATKGAANAYLVKAYVYQAKWAEAKALAETIVASNKYSLTPDYRDVFTDAQDNGVESIFDVQHAHIATGDWGDDNEGQVTSIFQGNRTSKYQEGWGFNNPTQELVDEYEAMDPRKYSTVIQAGDTMWARTLDGAPNAKSEVADMGQSWTGYHNRKYLVDYIDPADEMSNDRKNWRAFRYADLLLFHAEAAIQAGDIAGGLVSLNKVRARASASTIAFGVPAANIKAPIAALPPVVAATKDDALKAVYHERRVELAMEGHRFFDVARRGEGATEFTTTVATGTKGGGPRTFDPAKNTFFPITEDQTKLCPELSTYPK